MLPAGSCSFCGNPESRALAGIPGRATRICDHCVGLCCEILGARLLGQEPPQAVVVVYRDESFQQRLAAVLAHVVASGREARMRDLTGSAEGSPPSFELFDCSFCDAHRSDTNMMVSGPRVFICERCTAEAATALSRVFVDQ